MWNEATRERPAPASDPEPASRLDERRVAAWIGKSLVVQGRVVSSEDLTIDGQVEGTIELGDRILTIGTGAAIKADLAAHTIVVAGAVTGNINATGRVELRATASVEGDVIAPRLLMADGALVHGRVETSVKGAAPATRT